ncbi:unnamed protein product [Schistosoma margrebowiei]|uniref:Uncharacterized protein n=1 Tax=Schistosoma margrebowiei TaxID=48269 RepID=A0A3P8CYS5_9TREM|nr:unnamed protein product [Schistosoma margrebowiei]
MENKVTLNSDELTSLPLDNRFHINPPVLRNCSVSCDSNQNHFPVQNWTQSNMYK